MTSRSILFVIFQFLLIGMTYLGICPGHVRSSSFQSSFFFGEVANVRLWWLEPMPPFRLAVRQCLKPGGQRVRASFVQRIFLASSKKKKHGGRWDRKLDRRKWISKNLRCFTRSMQSQSALASYLVEVSGTGQFKVLCSDQIVLSSSSSSPMYSCTDTWTPGESTETSWTSWTWPQDGWRCCASCKPRQRSHAKKNGQKWDYWMCWESVVLWLSMQMMKMLSRWWNSWLMVKLAGLTF